MYLKSNSFATHRIGWSRLVVVFVVLYALLRPAPHLPTLFLDFGEMAGFGLLCIAALGRIWCHLYIAGLKNKVLTVHGPYSIVRNPLYIFSFLGVTGFGLAVENPYLALVLAGLFVVYYPSVVKREEQYLSLTLGQPFRDYCAVTPRWIPNFQLYRDPETLLVSPTAFRKGVLDAMWFLWAFLLWEMAEEIHLPHLLQSLF